VICEGRAESGQGNPDSALHTSVPGGELGHWRASSAHERYSEPLYPGPMMGYGHFL
jgi:hypothetical protein